MATLSEINNQVKTIENISEEVFKYEMEISHLHENSEYYIIHYNKIYTKQGYNYILKNADGNYYWATPGTKNFIESNKYPSEFEIKTYEYHKLINEHGDTYLKDSENPAAAEYKKPILELEADFKPVRLCSNKSVDNTKEYKQVSKQVFKNKVVDDYYVSSYIYGLKYTLDTNQKLETSKNNDEQFKDVNKSHLENLEKYFKKYHEEHEIREDLKFRFDNLEKYAKEKYENETKIFIKFYINEPNKDKLKIQVPKGLAAALDNIEKYVLDYYEAEAKRILRYY